jgi:UPF0755 protein
MGRILLVFGLIVVIVAGAIEWESANFSASGPPAAHGSETVVLIASGIGVQGVADTLGDAHVIYRPDLFALGVRIRRNTNKLKAGEYAIPSSASMFDIMSILMSGKAIQHKITAAEGVTSDMVWHIVQAEPALFGDPGPVPAEGTLLPETYLFTHGTTRSEIIARMKAARVKYLDAQWARRAPNLPIKTKEQAIILASIVEKETSIASERRHIAAVFEKRLTIGMRLQSDPTIIYGITKGYPLGRRIKESEITGATPYNTYVIPGLPAGPICNPGKDSIAAVLNPGQTSDLYFVANGTGGHSFAATQAEQDKNVAIWRKIHANAH